MRLIRCDRCGNEVRDTPMSGLTFRGVREESFEARGKGSWQVTIGPVSFRRDDGEVTSADLCPTCCIAIVGAGHAV